MQAHLSSQVTSHAGEGCSLEEGPAGSGHLPKLLCLRLVTMVTLPRLVVIPTLATVSHHLAQPQAPVHDPSPPPVELGLHEHQRHTKNCQGKGTAGSQSHCSPQRNLSTQLRASCSPGWWVGRPGAWIVSMGSWHPVLCSRGAPSKRKLCPAGPGQGRQTTRCSGHCHKLISLKETLSSCYLEPGVQDEDVASWVPSEGLEADRSMPFP